MIQKPLRRHRPWISRVPFATAVVVVTPLIPSFNVVQSVDAHDFRRGSVIVQRIPKETIVVPVVPRPKILITATHPNYHNRGRVYKFGPRNVTIVAPVTIRPPKPIRIARSLRPIQGRNVIRGQVIWPRVLKETVASIYPACSWGEHFQSHGWLTIQDQINAGFPIYIQPTPLTGSYEKIFDFGAIFDDLIVNLIWNQNQVAGFTTILPRIATSTDGISYTAFTNGRSLFVPSTRYVKARFEFTGSDQTAILEFFELIVNLNVKSEVDSGNVNADKDDVNGTAVLFNKEFKDVNSITLTVDSIEPLYAIYDFVDVPNPTGFSVYVYDSSGQRVDYLVSWKARGIT